MHDLAREMRRAGGISIGDLRFQSAYPFKFLPIIHIPSLCKKRLFIDHGGKKYVDFRRKSLFRLPGRLSPRKYLFYPVRGGQGRADRSERRGKTTLLRLILSELEPESGSLSARTASGSATSPRTAATIPETPCSGKCGRYLPRTSARWILCGRWKRHFPRPGRHGRIPRPVREI